MADNTNVQDGGQTAQGQAAANGQATDDTPRKLYATRADAEADKPAKATKHSKVYEVAKGGAVQGFIWANGYADCGQWAARREGYAFSTGKTKEVTKDEVANFLAGMSDADRAILIAQYVPAPTPAPAAKGRK